MRGRGVCHKWVTDSSRVVCHESSFQEYKTFGESPTEILLCVGGRLHGKGYMVNVLTGKGMGWDPLVHQKEHKKLVQKSIYSYKSIRQW